ncbi:MULTISPECIES: outer-membrane lipoprotein carrier protein LolA [unclassified Treponema]|uniref:LolA family protein n=1 Tax=unclassified Treponema TaxID=2638727 RepID=UPI0020A429EF|nr:MULTISPECIES: outer-membrane lipoprotein carrier protein LolA [unclassified Treponema]UTC66378.1 outer membrane lipoprotein carrier protein LolA [Treponema sp. OMZ 789]UTC69108.1 outer membrane lipoprotein carrier protein LolA [Treponema sp. OMZ 790]UTC71820.1 outer membrane lipoprotein carrier protein LolA [Treponema sp. OMZ 791]
MKKNIITILFVFIGSLCFSQNIITAGDLFSSVSDRYAQIQDYIVDMSISSGNSTQQATAMFKRPDKLRLDFRYPEEQCIVFNGSTLSIYLPQYRTILTQDVEQSNAGGSSLATPQGLSLIKRGYTIQYDTTSAPQPLEEGSSENVIILLMNRKSATEAFKTLRVMIYPDGKLIRRIEAIPVSGGKIRFDFHNYRINVGIGGKNFAFDAPSTAKSFNDFLFVD